VHVVGVQILDVGVKKAGDFDTEALAVAVRLDARAEVDQVIEGG